MAKLLRQNGDLHLKVDPRLKRDLVRMADEQGRELSGQVRWLLGQAVKSWKARPLDDSPRLD